MEKDGKKDVSINNKTSRILLALTLAAMGGIILFLNSGFYAIAKVNGKIIARADYQQRLDANMKYQTEFQKVDYDNSEGQSKLALLKKQLVDQMVEEKIISQKAKELNIQISNEETEKAFEKVANANGGNEKFSETVKKYYGYNKKEFVKNNIEPSVYKQKVQEKILSENLEKNAKEKAEKTLRDLKNGANFKETAKSQSEDEEVAKNGGDIGWIEKGKIEKELEAQAFSLETGKLSDIIKSTGGFSIIRVEEKKDNKVKISQILFKTKSFTQWLKDEVTTAKIKTYKY